MKRRGNFIAHHCLAVEVVGQVETLRPNCNRRLCSAVQSSLIRGQLIRQETIATQLSDEKDNNEGEAFDSNNVSIEVILPSRILLV